MGRIENIWSLTLISFRKQVRKLIGGGVDVVDGGEADLFGVEGVDADGLNFGGGEAGFTGSAGGCISLKQILAQGNPGPVVHCLTSFFVHTPLLLTNLARYTPGGS